jgi:hypothetical protein
MKDEKVLRKHLQHAVEIITKFRMGITHGASEPITNEPKRHLPLTRTL